MFIHGWADEGQSWMSSYTFPSLFFQAMSPLNLELAFLARLEGQQACLYSIPLLGLQMLLAMPSFDISVEI